MNALIGTRKTTILLRLAIALVLTALTSSATGDRGTTNLSENVRVCFVVDGQIYCIPGTGFNSTILRPGLSLR
jgi:hypothetical protein